MAIERFFLTSLGGSTRATGDPSRLQRLIAWQTDSDLPPSGTLYDYLGDGGAIAPAPSRVKRIGIRSSPEMLAQLEGKVPVQAANHGLGHLDPASRAQMMFWAQFLQRYSTTDLTDAYRHRFSEGQSSIAPGWLSIVNDDDLGRPVRYEQVIARAFNLAASPGGNVEMTVDPVAGRFDFHGLVTQTSGTGSTVPLARGHWDGNLADDATDYDIYIVAQENTGATTAGMTTVKCKVGSGGTLGSNILAYHGSTGVGELPYLANWYYVRQGASNALAGDEGESVHFHIPTGATWTSGDTFKIPRRRDRWSTSYPTAYPIPEVNAKLYIGSGGTAATRIPAQGGWTLSGAYAGVAQQPDTGGKQVLTVDRLGEREITLQVNRRLLDATLQNVNLRQDSLHAVITLYSDSAIGATAYKYGAAMVMPHLTITDTPAWSVQKGGQNRDEQITLRAGRVPDGGTSLTWSSLTFSNDLDVLIWNAIASVV